VREKIFLLLLTILNISAQFLALLLAGFSIILCGWFLNCIGGWFLA
jgi:hypothetical protein